jgi:tetratricopeptide (TPR) repeat protein
MHSSRRVSTLLGILLVLATGFAGLSIWQSLQAPEPVHRKLPLPGKNTIQSAEVRRGSLGQWELHVAYHYTGAPSNVQLRGSLVVEGAAPELLQSGRTNFGYRPAAPGTQTVQMEVARMGPAIPFASSHVLVEMRNATDVLDSKRVAQRIEWPDASTWLQERNRMSRTPTDLLNDAIAMIDVGNRGSLEDARRNLERLIGNDPQFDAAYVELARVAMKTNWGPEGLKHAENLLLSALKIRPDSVNARVLIGYVYTHQGRFKEAETKFEEASRSESKNLWLWANWGELLVKQGQDAAAIAKYQQAISRPRTYDTYDRARLDAYSRLIALQGKLGNLDAVEAVHKQRVQEFAGTCLGVEYARFVLLQRGDSSEAVTRARQANEGQCSGPDAREVLGLAYYTQWAAAEGSQRDELLRQARIYLPMGPRLVYQLASSDRTVGALQRMKASGESIEVLDNRHYNALALALEDRDLAAVKRLLKLGANSTAPIGAIEMPVALLPVVAEDIEAIRLFQQHGVDYAKLRYQGATALEHARRTGNRRLLSVLTPVANS